VNRQDDRRSGRQLAIGMLAGVVAATAVLWVRLVWLGRVNHDEVEHLHVGFKIAEGLLPYRDFYQNHLPAFWLSSMLWIRAFPFSVDAVLAGRALGILALGGCWLAGLRLLGGMPAGRTWLARGVYTWATLVLAHRFEISVARPDAIMTVLATAAACLYPLHGGLSNGRALACGALLGLAASVSLKMLPIALVPPCAVALVCLRERRLGPAVALPFLGLGFGLGVIGHDLVDAFRFDVLDLNRALSKPWAESFRFLYSPIYVPAAAGALGWLLADLRRRRGLSNGSVVLALWLASGLALSLLARHDAPYNLQLMTIPLAIGFAGLVTGLWIRVGDPVFRVILLVALLGYPAIHTATSLGRLRDYGGITQADLQRLVDLARPGDRTCTGFSPWHPIWCRDVSGLSNEWDAHFVSLVREPQQRERFRRIWQEGVRRTIEERPHVIVRRSYFDIWAIARRGGMITPEQIEALDALAPEYRAVAVGRGRVWVRRPGL
jgi:hypothetical protein